jgi:hypothetical protein
MWIVGWWQVGELAIVCVAVMCGAWLTSVAWMVRQIARSADDEAMVAHATFVICLGAGTAIIPVGAWTIFYFGTFPNLVVAAMVVLEAILLFAVAILLALLMHGLVQLVDKSLAAR